jgi:hypothetical protein
MSGTPKRCGEMVTFLLQPHSPGVGNPFSIALLILIKNSNKFSHQWLLCAREWLDKKWFAPLCRNDFSTSFADNPQIRDLTPLARSACTVSVPRRFLSVLAMCHVLVHEDLYRTCFHPPVSTPSLHYRLPSISNLALTFEWIERTISEEACRRPRTGQTVSQVAQ